MICCLPVNKACWHRPHTHAITIAHDHTCNIVFPTWANADVPMGMRRHMFCFHQTAGRERRAPSLRLREAAGGRTGAARGLKWLPLPPREASRPERVRQPLAEERSQRLSSRPMPSSAPWPFTEKQKSRPGQAPRQTLKGGFVDQIDGLLHHSHNSIVWLLDHCVPAGIQTEMHFAIAMEHQNASDSQWRVRPVDV